MGWGAKGWGLRIAVAAFALVAVPVGIGLVLPVWVGAALGYRQFVIPGESMAPTILAGDRIFGKAHDGQLARGDLVMFQHPVTEAVHVSRLIGVAGDEVAMAGGRPVLNGARLVQQALGQDAVPFLPTGPARGTPRCKTPVALGETCVRDLAAETLPGGARYGVLDVGAGPLDELAPVVVPEGHVFVLGDNRDNAVDSRLPAPRGGIGPVPVERIIGRAVRVHWSAATVGEDWVLRWDRFGRALR